MDCDRRLIVWVFWHGVPVHGHGDLTIKRGDTMNRINYLPDDELETEGMPDKPQVDRIFVLDGRGRVVEKEVKDDAGDN